MRTRGGVGLSVRLGAVLLVIGAAAVACHLVTRSPGHPVTLSPPVPESSSAAEPGQPWFVNVAEASGLTFRHFDPATPVHYIHETLGSGLGWIDYDGDGWLDLFCVQDGPV